MAPTVFARTPDLIDRQDVVVMLQSTEDDLPHIQRIWPSFEDLVGRRGRKMFAMIDTKTGTYAVCTPRRVEDPPAHFGLELGTLPGGRYLRGRIAGDPPDSYDRIGLGMQELESMVMADQDRPLVEFYRRHDQIELWVPVAEASSH